MPKVLFNPTNEVLECFYVGEKVTIPSGAKIRVDDPRGRQVLNELGRRGLRELEFGDEGAGELRKAEEGREANRDFKRKQIMNFNAVQDQRVQQKLPYLVPEPFLKEYAKELGMVLYEPYSSTDESKREGVELRDEIRRKENEIAEKDKALEALKTQVGELTGLVQKILTAGSGAVQGADEWEEVRKKIRGINRNHFANWVAANFQLVEGYPEGLRQEIEDKYTRMYNLPFPQSVEEAQSVPA
jgi:hypothetical protein